MGLLSDNYGVIGGLGQAITKNADNAREERLAALQHQRTVALEQMRQQHQAGESQKNRDLTASEGGKNRQVEIGGQMRQDDRQDKELRTRRDEGAADRKNRKEIAEIDANSRVTAANKRGANAKRWTVNKVKSSTTGKDGISETEEIVLTDNQNARTFKQKGDKFIPQGGEVKGSAPQAAVSRLLADPNLADDFLAYYGYLPAGFMGGGGQQGSSADNDEEE